MSTSDTLPTPERDQIAALRALVDEQKAQNTGLGQSIVVSNGTSRNYGSKEVVMLSDGDVVSLRTSGAGGYGSPSERDPTAIAADIADGYVTAPAARAVYGARANDGNAR